MSNLIIRWDKIDENLSEEILLATRKGMNKTVSKIRSATKRLIKSSIPNATKPNDKFNDTLIEGARVIKYNETSYGLGTAGAHILGTRSKGSGTYRLRFFEKGTKERFVKEHYRKNRNGNGTHRVKGHSVGSIRGHRFFSTAVSNEIHKIDSTINEELKKAIERCNG